jgi:hypothetical protein
MRETSGDALMRLDMILNEMYFYDFYSYLFLGTCNVLFFINKIVAIFVRIRPTGNLLRLIAFICSFCCFFFGSSFQHLCSWRQALRLVLRTLTAILWTCFAERLRILTEKARTHR